MDDTLSLKIKQNGFFLPPPPPPPSAGLNLNSWVTPNTLLIILVLSVIFFVCVILHLLLRFLLQPPNRGPDETDSVTALQGQLQQLFNLHDAGVDQSFIDALPVFSYRSITGVKDPFDCAVCLCGFEPEDKLRLLPECSHAFHSGCIDMWLLSHSTCPLCRASLLADSSIASRLSVEFGSENFPEMVPDGEPSGDFIQSVEIEAGEEDARRKPVVSVKLGKFRSVNNAGVEEGGTEARRCFSMGSFVYVMDENMSFQVPIRTPMEKQPSKKLLKRGHRPAMSECGWDSRREFCDGFEPFGIRGMQCVDADDNKSIGGRKEESFSVSKIWLRGIRKEEEKTVSSRPVVSFRFPVDGDDLKAKGYGGSEVEEEVRRCNSLDSHAGTQSFTRKTLVWITGRPNKVVHSSSPSSNV